MSSSGFETTFRNGCEWVLVQFGASESIKRILHAIREKANRPESDPRKDRLLFVDPALLAQQLDVPFETVELVTRYLHRMNILELWLRFVCPNPPDGANEIILETCDSEVATRVLQEPCPICGNIHELTWDIIDTVYAINKDMSDRPRRFSLKKLRYVPIPSSQLIRPESLAQDRCEDFPADNATFRRDDEEGEVGLSVTGNGARSVVRIRSLIVVALHANGQSQGISSPQTTLGWILLQIGLLAVIVCVIVITIAVLASHFLALAMLVAIVVVVGLCTKTLVKDATGTQSLERYIVFGGTTLGGIISAAGLAGLRLKGGMNPDEKTHLEFDYGSPDYRYVFVIVGMAVFLFSCIIAFFIFRTRLAHRMNSIDDGKRSAPLLIQDNQSVANADNTVITATAALIKIQFIAGDRGGGSRAQLPVPREEKGIKDAIQRATHRNAFEFAPSVFAASVNDVIACLQHKPSIFHFVGHGEQRGLLLVRDKDPLIETMILYPGQAEVLFRDPHFRIRMVVFNTCRSLELARHLTARNVVDIAVGVENLIEDDHAVQFAITLYGQLAEGRSVSRAFELASVHLAGVDASANPQLLVAAGIDPAAVFFCSSGGAV